jgi:hypothetical protein
VLTLKVEEAQLGATGQPATWEVKEQQLLQELGHPLLIASQLNLNVMENVTAQPVLILFIMDPDVKQISLSAHVTKFSTSLDNTVFLALKDTFLIALDIIAFLNQTIVEEMKSLVPEITAMNAKNVHQD